jgi:hypothetical protein
MRENKTESRPEKRDLNTRFFRPGSVTDAKLVRFVISDGGMGDYIAYMSSILWIARNHPQVNGQVYCGHFFIEIAEYILKDFSNWQVFDRDKKFNPKLEIPTRGPMLMPINVTGCHPLDLGFMYYCNMNPPPEDGNYYPEIDVSEYRLPAGLEAPYAVMTPGAASPNRTMPVSAFNGIKDHLVSLGITPVFLGKEQMTPKRSISFDKDYDFSEGINLINQTSLLQSVKIISEAKLIVGLDNGLLHLAATTMTPIIFGYNIASPQHRRPRRKKGEIYEIFPDTRTLNCTFCQSQMRFMFSHDFTKCSYEDMACLKELSDPAPWISLIDGCLGDGR